MLAAAKVLVKPQQTNWQQQLLFALKGKNTGVKNGNSRCSKRNPLKYRQTMAGCLHKQNPAVNLAHYFKTDSYEENTPAWIIYYGSRTNGLFFADQSF
jgi:hypothetical protein